MHHELTALVLLLAGCGSDDPPAATPEEDMSSYSLELFAADVTPPCPGTIPCTQHGRCTRVDGLCSADPTSCLKSLNCQKYGECAAVQHADSSLVTCEKATATCKSVDGDSVLCGDDNPCTFDFCNEDGCQYGWSVTPVSCTGKGKEGVCSQGTCSPGKGT